MSTMPKSDSPLDHQTSDNVSLLSMESGSNSLSNQIKIIHKKFNEFESDYYWKYTCNCVSLLITMVTVFIIMTIMLITYFNMYNPIPPLNNTTYTTQQEIQITLETNTLNFMANRDWEFFGQEGARAVFYTDHNGNILYSYYDKNYVNLSFVNDFIKVNICCIENINNNNFWKDKVMTYQDSIRHLSEVLLEYKKYIPTEKEKYLNKNCKH